MSKGGKEDWGTERWRMEGVCGLEVKKTAWRPHVGRDWDRDRVGVGEVVVVGPGLVNLEEGREGKQKGSDEADSMLDARCCWMLMGGWWIVRYLLLLFCVGMGERERNKENKKTQKRDDQKKGAQLSGPTTRNASNHTVDSG